MEVLVVIGLVSLVIAFIAIKDAKRQKAELEQVFTLELPIAAPVKKKAAKKKPVKKAVKKKAVKKTAKKAVKKAVKKKPKTDKKKASVKK